METKPSKWGAAAVGVFGNLVGVYLFIATVLAAPYFNWQYARQNGFFAWLTFGQIVPTAKAFIWPYYVFGREYNASGDNAEHFANSMSYWQSAAKILKDINQAKAATPSEALTMRRLFEKALAEAKQVDLSELNKHHPSFGDKYRAYFIVGVQDVLDALANKNESQLQSGFALLNSWADWFEPRAATIFRR